MPIAAQQAMQSFELRFVSLVDPGRGFAFPCDAQGNVNLDELSERGRTSYFGARALIGRDFAYPSVLSVLAGVH